MNAQFATASVQRQVLERYLTRAEEKKLFSHIKRLAGHYARRDYAWMRLMRFTGMRLGSVRRLTVRDARLALQLERLHVRKEIAKGQRAYDIPLSEPAKQALKDLLAVRRAMRLAEEADAPLICSRLGHAMAERTYEFRMQALAQSAGLSVIPSPHWWRHTMGQRVKSQTTAADALGVVQVLLGHASRSSTAIYTLPTREEVALAAQEGAY